MKIAFLRIILFAYSIIVSSYSYAQSLISSNLTGENNINGFTDVYSYPDVINTVYALSTHYPLIEIDSTDIGTDSKFQPAANMLSDCVLPVIVAQPASQVTTEGDWLTFTVGVDGTPPFTYQWYKNDVLIPGANGPMCYTPPLTMADSGTKYYCIVTNCKGSTTSNPGIVSVKSISNPAPLACITKHYSKSYFYNDVGTIHSFLEIPDHKLLLSGEMTNDVVIMKTDEDGNTIWCNKYSQNPLGAAYTNTRTLLDNDNNLLTAFDQNSTVILAAIDTAGNPIKASSISLPQETLVLVDLGMADNGDKILLLDRNNNGIYILLRLSPDLSKVIWSKQFDSYSFKSYYSLTLKNLLIDRNRILIPSELGILCFDASTGNFIERKYYTTNGNNPHITTIYRCGSGYLLKFSAYEIQSWGIVRVDSALNLVNAYTFPSLNNREPLEIFPTKDGSYYAAYDYTLGRIMYVSQQDSILWSHWSITVFNASPLKIIGTSQNLFALGISNYNVGVGSPGSYFGYLGIEKADYNGRSISCSNGENTVNTAGIDISMATFSAIVNEAPILTFNTAQISPTPFSFIENFTCSGESTCSSVDIIGETSLCGSGTATYTARKNNGCYLPVQWEITGGLYNKQDINDSTVDIRFLESGSYRLIASLKDACFPIADTQTIHVTLTKTSLALGPDSNLCPGNTLTLNAKKGFTSYVWQDGSTDSLIIVSEPGTYYVHATDACGNIFSDTVIVATHPQILLDLGPNRNKCNNDTVHINAPNGFLNYTWSNNYNISSIASQDVVVNPMMDTAYYLKAEKTPGCFAYDTVRVNVNHSPAIQLGIDQSLCAGDSIYLDAGNGFVQYAWSNGATTSGIFVKNAGSFSITASDLHGCKSYDTLKVLNVFNNPIVSLGHDSTLCINSTRVLYAEGFASYLWNDGSKLSTLTINSKGSYSVEVTDDHGCRGRDTTIITTLLPKPSNFLAADTSICSYGSLTLSPAGNFKNLYWSSGGTGPSLTITQPGVYWLQLQDNNNCLGIDSIIVSLKDCMTGFYVPSAFTPNGDGKNDVLRPLLFGNVKKFQFTVYNRWGQIIYQTAELNKGWNGNYAGSNQDSNVFVWTCTYQLEGQEIKTEKGSVVLIR